MSLENNEPTGQTDNIDVDALMSQLEAPAPERPMLEAAPNNQDQSNTQDHGSVQTPQEYAFQWNGKEVKAPIEKILQWASQGYDYPQKMAQFKQEREKWEGEKSNWEKGITPYKTIDEYAKQNPDWWQHVEQSYQQRIANAQQGGHTNPEIEALRSELSELKKFKTDFESEKTAKLREQEDETLSKEIQSIRTTYKDLDWDTPDESGQSLEAKVLRHAIDHGINNFRAAFLDFNREHLEKLWQERGKEQAQKELQKRTKLGLLGSSPTPKTGIAPAEGVKNKSYEDLFREALEEAGIAS